MLTQWQDKAALEASESARRKVRADAQDIVGGDLDVGIVEQVMFDVAKPPQLGARLLIRPTSMDPRDQLPQVRRERLSN